MGQMGFGFLLFFSRIGQKVGKQKVGQQKFGQVGQKFGQQKFGGEVCREMGLWLLVFFSGIIEKVEQNVGQKVGLGLCF